MKLIGRENEREILRESLHSTRSELIAIYGRRRVGKTFLIREFYEKNMAFEITGLSIGSMKDQISNFCKELDKRGLKGKYKAPKKWIDAFALLESYLDKRKGKAKKVVFIDEFPWISTPKSNFLTAFENFWNSYCAKRKDIVVVICGSSASYMVKNILRNKKGLHNRLTRSIRLMPFNLNETKSFLRSRNIAYTDYDIIQLYMAIGGVPHYLDKLSRGLSIAQNLDRLFFHRQGGMKDEFRQLYASLFNDSNKHIAIIRALAKVNRGMTRNDLSRMSGLTSGGDLSLKLEDLIESGFVKEYPFYKNKKQLTLYRLSDEYTKLYIKFIEPNRHHTSGTWLKLSNTSSFKAWSGFAFENICLKHIEQIKFALRIDQIYSMDSSWFNKDAQIDLLIDRDDHVINLCEMKFHHGPYTIDRQNYLNIRNKIQAFKSETKTRKNIHVTMITAFGLKKNQYSNEIIEKHLDCSALFSF